MQWEERAQWLAKEVLPSEEDVRNWLGRRIRGVSRTDIDDAIQECYARLWEIDHTRIVNARAYFFTIARNVVGEMMRRSRVVSIAMEGPSARADTVSVAMDDQSNMLREEMKQLNQALTTVRTRRSEGAAAKTASWRE